MIDNIRLQDFRGYRDASFEFDSGVNIVVGPNGSGKTNLIEAILVLASGSSYRAKDSELVHFSRPWARLDGWFDHGSRTLKLVVSGEKIIKSFAIDDKAYSRLNLERSLPVVVFEPNHLQLLLRGPEWRREYFDDVLTRTLPTYKTLAANYRRTLAQRNALLKQPPATARNQLFAWNIRLSELGAQIALARRGLVEQINQRVSDIYSKIAHQKSEVKVVYDSPISQANYSTKLLSKLEAHTELDLKRGFTAYGPHREDFVIYLNNQPASISASRGEIRSLVLAIKIIELRLLEAARDQKPILLLDDVFSELDGARRRHLVKALKGYQTIITTTDAEAILEYFADKHNLIPLQRNSSKK